ncbi:DUF1641 domain-containing protein [Metabacillus halosaccharovorans]|uniref:DUF1641 domain-containing protein n=1 Tax=Metabacillus halosaccharovorans TaxID=930124 RepID=A0ABT3DBD7_9BACI|nr:hypothetical protein [Metabacillus halosaccharovorans]MCV9884362.1 hypothetical protein [Metabacillus halosaccharovorans]
MAKPIRQIRREFLNEQEEQDQAMNEILKELAENKEAVLAFIQTAKELHELKVFETTNSLLKQSDEVGAIAIQQINQPAVHNMIKSGFGLFKFLGALQPSQLQTILDGVTLGLKRMSETGENGEKQSIWRLRKRLTSPATRAALTTMIDFVEGMGEVFLRNRRNSK